MEEFCIQSLTLPGVDPIYGLEVEKFVNGPMYHIDGLVLNGKFLKYFTEHIKTYLFRKDDYMLAIIV
jgi:hypothetical protein